MHLDTRSPTVSWLPRTMAFSCTECLQQDKCIWTICIWVISTFCPKYMNPIFFCFASVTIQGLTGKVQVSSKTNRPLTNHGWGLIASIPHRQLQSFAKNAKPGHFWSRNFLDSGYSRWFFFFAEAQLFAGFFYISFFLQNSCSFFLQCRFFLTCPGANFPPPSPGLLKRNLCHLYIAFRL